jgi:hypothetical protein
MITPAGAPRPACTAKAHHWRLEEAVVATVLGTCSLCGIQAYFYSYEPPMDAFENASRGRARAAAQKRHKSARLARDITVQALRAPRAPSNVQSTGG